MNTLFKKTSLAVLILSCCASPAFSFDPGVYKYKEQPISVDGDRIVVLRIYDKGQKIEFSAEDLNSDEGDSSEVKRSFTQSDLANVQASMRYVKDVFGAPAVAPVIETATDTDENASFASPVTDVSESEDEGSISDTRLSTYFTNKEKSTQLPTGLLTIGKMGDKDGDTLSSLTNRGEGAAMSSVIVHEMMHGMGIATSVDNEKDAKGVYHFSAAKDNSTFSEHLYDISSRLGDEADHQLQPGMAFEKIAYGSKPSELDENTFYQYDNDSQCGAYFWGENVEKVLTVDGKTTKLALADNDLNGMLVKGIPVNGYEDDYDDDKNIVSIPEMSHLELQNSMMSHQSYRNWGTFMEAELAVLQDIGYDIDRRKFFGFSVYNSGLTYTNPNGFNSTQDWGVGLHIYGIMNTITQGANISTKGDASYGIRIDGRQNTLIIPEETKILAQGKNNIGVLVSYGRNHVLNLQGDIKATGAGGNALQFDFGGNLLGDQDEYRGSYFQVSKNDETGKWANMDDEGITSALYGPMAEQVDISGNIEGENAAIYISDNALVRRVNILDSAEIKGDIISEWSSTGNRYGKYGKGMTLFKPEDEVDRTLLTFGFAADEEGYATQYADDEFEMEYNGNIIGADGFDVQLAGGKLVYGGTADVNILQTEEDTELALSGGNLAVNNLSAKGKVSASGTSNVVVTDEEGTAQFSGLTVNENANLEINAGTGTVAIDDMNNSGNAEFKTDKIEKNQITIDSYSGTDASVLSLDFNTQQANQLQGSTAKQAVQQASQVLSINNNQTSSGLNIHIVEGDINGEINAVVNPDGKVIATSEKKNASVVSLQNIISNEFQIFRAQMNDLEKRMGDLRNMPSQNGAWAKVITGQSKYKDLHDDYKTFQMGADHYFCNSDMYVGLMGSYTDGDGKLNHGTTDEKNYTFGIYGGWLGKDGQFIDMTFKYHHLKSDYGFTANNKYSKGNFNTSGISSSVEYGWRLGINRTNFYVEPQTEFLYGYLNGANHITSNGVHMTQSDIKSAVGRLGMAIGWLAPNRKGNIYVKGSVLNDWQGKSKIVVSKGNASRRYNEDMGGTWGSFALGGTGNINKKLSVYGEAETAVGSPVRTTYEFNVGLRYNF